MKPRTQTGTIAPRDIRGWESGLLVAVREDGYIGKARAWLCDCRCGGTKRLRTGDITTKSYTHCGCRNRRKVLRPCKRCGAEFLVKKSDRKVYCSRGCYESSRPARVSATCAQCGKSFTYQPCEARKSKSSRREHCSRGCFDDSRVVSEPLEVRFWRHVQKTEGCWIWTGPKGGGGYGALHLGRGVVAKAHRLSWELSCGRIPDGLWVLHKCDNPPCVRPDHLFLGTAKDNALDRDQKGRGHVRRIWQTQALGTLNEAIVWAIRLLNRNKLATRAEIAKRFDLNESTVAQAIRGVTWKHVE